MLERTWGAADGERMTVAEVWEGLMGDQTPAEFLALSRERGAASIEEAVERYLDDDPGAPMAADTGLDRTEVAAALVAMTRWPGLPPAAVNVGALALAMRRHLVVHRMSAGAVRLVHSTDLHALPGEPPRLLRGPWIIEARRPDRDVLFGDTASLGGYVLDDALYLVGLRYPDGAMVAPWRPRWEERDLEAGMPAALDSPLISDLGAHNAWAREAARFAIVLGLLLDAEGAPMTVEDEAAGGSRGRGTASGERRRPVWSVRRIYLDEPPRRDQRDRPDGDGRGDATPGADRHAEQVAVRGHLRRQRFGPGRSERRWIYVHGYEARRWVAPQTQVDVRVHDDREEGHRQ